MRLKEDAEKGSIASILATMREDEEPNDAEGVYYHPQKVSKLEGKASDNDQSMSSSDKNDNNMLNIFRKDIAQKTPDEIEQQRRERNRMHAKKTRLRKKKVLADMQQAVENLQNEIYSLKTMRGVASHSSGMESMIPITLGSSLHGRPAVEASSVQSIMGSSPLGIQSSKFLGPMWSGPPEPQNIYTGEAMDGACKPL